MIGAVPTRWDRRRGKVRENENVLKLCVIVSLRPQMCESCGKDPVSRSQLLWVEEGYKEEGHTGQKESGS